MKEKGQFENNIEDFGFKELYIGRVYATWIFSIIKPYLGRCILEIGCGLGNMIDYYSPSSELIQSDIEDEYLAIVKKRLAGRKNSQAIKLDILNLTATDLDRLKKRNIDTVVAINVLEHIKDDNGALKNIYRLIKDKGKIILFVPAIPFIFGTLDEAFEHYRRYRKVELVEKMEKAGFKTVVVRFFNIVGIFWWLIAGRILKMRKLPLKTGYVLNLLVPILALLERLILPPIGQSLIVVGKKD